MNADVAESASRRSTQENIEASRRVLPVLPFKPRPVMFGLLLAVFLLWCAGLAVMYFKTIAPKNAGKAADSIRVGK